MSAAAHLTVLLIQTKKGKSTSPIPWPAPPEIIMNSVGWDGSRSIFFKSAGSIRRVPGIHILVWRLPGLLGLSGQSAPQACCGKSTIK